MANGTIIITRPRFEDGGRRYRIIVDGNRVGRLKPYEEIRLELSEGEHSGVARIDWCRSNFVAFQVRSGELTELEVGSNLRGWAILGALYFITLGFWQYLYFRPRPTGFTAIASGEQAAK